MKHRLTFVFLLAACCLWEPFATLAQSYNDGPIQLQVRLRDIRVRYNSNSSSDFNLNVGSLGLSNFEDDELTFFVWAQDNSPISGLAWGAGSGCRQANLQMLNGGPDFSPDYNVVLFNYTYPAANVPQYVQLRLDAWEDDVPSDFAIISGLTPCGSSGSRCTYNTNVCCLNFFGCIFREGDDLRCDANPFKTDIDYRLASDPDGQDTWLFAYGSLIWKPELEHVEMRRGTAQGWHHSFCFRIERFRGTREQPGLMMSLDRGGQC